MINQPTMPPRMAPGMKRTPDCRKEIADCSRRDDSGSSTCHLISAISSRRGARYMVAKPPRMPKNHHGNASLPWLPCAADRSSPAWIWDDWRVAKMEAARAGVIVMALIAEMIMDAE